MDSFEMLRQIQKGMLEQSNLLRQSVLPHPALRDALKTMHIPGALERAMLRDVTRALGERRTLGIDLSALRLPAGALESASVLQSMDWLAREQTLWQGISKGLAASGVAAPQTMAALLPATLWMSSVKEIWEGLQSVRLPELHPSLTDRLLEPYFDFSRFARGTVKRIERSEAPAEVNALSGALVLAEEHVAESADLLVESVEDEGTVEGTGTLPEVPSRLLQVQRRELLSTPEISEAAEYDELVQAAPSAALAAQTREIIKAVVWCNRQAQALTGEEIFKLTTTFLGAQNELAWTAAVKDLTLGHMVDCLYFMLYEGAGKDQLRFLKYIQKEDCGVVFTIKHLRHKLYRHDLEHGSAGDVRKSYRDLGAALKAAGPGSPPRRKEEFQMIQRNLLRQLAEFMDRLQDALSRTGGE